MAATAMEALHRWNGLDWVLVAVLTWSTLSAFARGLVRVLFSLAGWSVGILLASWYCARLAPRLLSVCRTRPLSEAVAYGLILAAVVVAASLLGGLTHKAVKAVGLGFFNRLGGAAVGAARGCLIGVSLLMLAVAFLPKSEVGEEIAVDSLFPCGCACGMPSSYPPNCRCR